MVLRGKPVGEQGAADRWTALSRRCGAGPSGPRSFPLFRHPFLISKLSICHPLFGWIAILLYSYISAERLIIFTLPWAMMQ